MNARFASLPVAAASFAVSVLAPALSAQTGPVDYRQILLDGSTYHREYCLGPCACALGGATGPLAGAFTMIYSHQDQWTVYYDIVDVDLTGSTDREANIHYVGTGTYAIGGDFAYTHQLVLDLVPLHEDTLALHHFDSGVLIVPPESHFPAMAITASTEVLACNQRTLDIRTASAVIPGCPADIGTAGGAPGRDGALDNNDFIVFIGYFFEGDLRADRGTAGGHIGSDGEFDNNDFIAFIDQFFAGCRPR
jgi:hypothetical protein